MEIFIGVSASAWEEVMTSQLYRIFPLNSIPYLSIYVGFL